MSLLDRLARQVMKPATIETMQRIAAHTYRLSLGGPALADWAYERILRLEHPRRSGQLAQAHLFYLGLRCGSTKAGVGHLHVF